MEADTKQFPCLPKNFPEVYMKFLMTLLKENPRDVYEFSAKYFEKEAKIQEETRGTLLSEEEEEEECEEPCRSDDFPTTTDDAVGDKGLAKTEQAQATLNENQTLFETAEVTPQPEEEDEFLDCLDKDGVYVHERQNVVTHTQTRLSGSRCSSISGGSDAESERCTSQTSFHDADVSLLAESKFNGCRNARDLISEKEIFDSKVGDSGRPANVWISHISAEMSKTGASDCTELSASIKASRLGEDYKIMAGEETGTLPCAGETPEKEDHHTVLLSPTFARAVGRNRVQPTVTSSFTEGENVSNETIELDNRKKETSLHSKEDTVHVDFAATTWRSEPKETIFEPSTSHRASVSGVQAEAHEKSSFPTSKSVDDDVNDSITKQLSTLTEKGTTWSGHEFFNSRTDRRWLWSESCAECRELHCGSVICAGKQEQPEEREHKTGSVREAVVKSEARRGTDEGLANHSPNVSLAKETVRCEESAVQTSHAQEETVRDSDILDMFREQYEQVLNGYMSLLKSSSLLSLAKYTREVNETTAGRLPSFSCAYENKNHTPSSRNQCSVEESFSEQKEGYIGSTCNDIGNVSVERTFDFVPEHRTAVSVLGLPTHRHGIVRGSDDTWQPTTKHSEALSKLKDALGEVFRELQSSRFNLGESAGVCDGMEIPSVRTSTSCTATKQHTELGLTRTEIESRPQCSVPPKSIHIRKDDCFRSTGCCAVSSRTNDDHCGNCKEQCNVGTIDFKPCGGQMASRSSIPFAASSSVITEPEKRMKSENLFREILSDPTPGSHDNQEVLKTASTSCGHCSASVGQHNPKTRHPQTKVRNLSRYVRKRNSIQPPHCGDASLNSRKPKGRSTTWRSCHDSPWQTTSGVATKDSLGEMEPASTADGSNIKREVSVEVTRSLLSLQSLEGDSFSESYSSCSIVTDESIPFEKVPLPTLHSHSHLLSRDKLKTHSSKATSGKCLCNECPYENSSSEDSKADRHLYTTASRQHRGFVPIKVVSDKQPFDNHAQHNTSVFSGTKGPACTCKCVRVLKSCSGNLDKLSEWLTSSYVCEPGGKSINGRNNSNEKGSRSVHRNSSNEVIPKSSSCNPVIPVERKSHESFPAKCLCTDDVRTPEIFSPWSSSSPYTKPDGFRENSIHPAATKSSDSSARRTKSSVHQVVIRDENDTCLQSRKSLNLDDRKWRLTRSLAVDNQTTAELKGLPEKNSEGLQGFCWFDNTSVSPKITYTLAKYCSDCRVVGSCRLPFRSEGQQASENSSENSRMSSTETKVAQGVVCQHSFPIEKAGTINGPRHQQRGHHNTCCESCSFVSRFIADGQRGLFGGSNKATAGTSSFLSDKQLLSPNSTPDQLSVDQSPCQRGSSGNGKTDASKPETVEDGKLADETTSNRVAVAETSSNSSSNSYRTAPSSRFSSYRDSSTQTVLTKPLQKPIESGRTSLRSFFMYRSLLKRDVQRSKGK